MKEPGKPGDEPVDITPKEFGVRTVAQEYGGGAFRVSGDTVIFSNYKDQRLYKQSLNVQGIFDHLHIPCRSLVFYFLSPACEHLPWQIYMLYGLGYSTMSFA